MGRPDPAFEPLRALAVSALARQPFDAQRLSRAGVSMPSAYSSEHSRSDASDLAQRIGAKYREVPIRPMVVIAWGPSFSWGSGAEPARDLYQLRGREQGREPDGDPCGRQVRPSRQGNAKVPVVPATDHTQLAKIAQLPL